MKLPSQAGALVDRRDRDHGPAEAIERPIQDPLHGAVTLCPQRSLGADDDLTGDGIGSVLGATQVDQPRLVDGALHRVQAVVRAQLEDPGCADFRPRKDPEHVADRHRVVVVDLQRDGHAEDQRVGFQLGRREGRIAFHGGGALGQPEFARIDARAGLDAPEGLDQLDGDTFHLLAVIDLDGPARIVAADDRCLEPDQQRRALTGLHRYFAGGGVASSGALHLERLVGHDPGLVQGAVEGREPTLPASDQE